MFNKRLEIKTASVEQILGDAPPEQKPEFKVGTKFYLRDKEWIVQRAWRESGARMRHLQSNFGDEEIHSLHILQEDEKAPGFMYLEATPKELMMLKAKASAMGWEKDRD